MLATVRNPGPRHDSTQPMSAAVRRETLDLARRSRYLVLLRRWAQERLPAGTKAALDAAEWIRDVVLQATDSGSAFGTRQSLLVRLRTRLLADRSTHLWLRAVRSAPTSRVEQLIGHEQLAVWEEALTELSPRQRDLVILRIEFGLDFAAIAAETGDPVELTRAETVNALASLIDVLGNKQQRRAA